VKLLGQKEGEQMLSQAYLVKSSDTVSRGSSAIYLQKAKKWNGIKLFCRRTDFHWIRFDDFIESCRSTARLKFKFFNVWS
jgi:hypothetical protein